MQNPVIQRIKRRAEVCQSLPVTCGRRGNDTGNDLVTVVSLQYAVDCFPENGKSSHSKPVTSPLPPSAKCRLDVFFAYGASFVRYGVEACRGEYRLHIGKPRPPRSEDDGKLPCQLRARGTREKCCITDEFLIRLFA